MSSTSPKWQKSRIPTCLRQDRGVTDYATLTIYCLFYPGDFGLTSIQSYSSFPL